MRFIEVLSCSVILATTFCLSTHGTIEPRPRQNILHTASVGIVRKKSVIKGPTAPNREPLGCTWSIIFMILEGLNRGLESTTG